MNKRTKYAVAIGLFIGIVIGHYADTKATNYEAKLLAQARAEEYRIDFIQDSLIQRRIDSLEAIETREAIAALLEQQRQRLITQQQAQQQLAAQQLRIQRARQQSHTVRGDASAYQEKRQQQDFSHIPAGKVRRYVARFHSTAVAEQAKFGIPASISLAQGILESNSGTSTLSVKSKNDFGIKCHKRRCNRGHCSKYNDDSPNDRFVNFQSNWFSWRAHSYLLTDNQRYAAIFNSKYSAKPFTRYSTLPGRNYRRNGSWWYGTDPNFNTKLAAMRDNWNVPYKRFAYGLDLVGYATSNRYAESLIGLIEKYNLQQYDAK